MRFCHIKMNATFETSFIGRSDRFCAGRGRSGFGHHNGCFGRSSLTCRRGWFRLGSSVNGFGFRGARASCSGGWRSFRRLQGQAEQRQGESEGEESNRASHEDGDTPVGFVGPNFRIELFIRSGYSPVALVALGPYEQGLPKRP